MPWPRAARNARSRKTKNEKAIPNKNLSNEILGRYCQGVETGVLPAVNGIVFTVTEKGLGAVGLVTSGFGLTPHAALGMPVQLTLKAMVSLTPPRGAACRLNVAVWPDGMVAEVEPPVAGPRDTSMPVPVSDTI